MGYIVWSVVKPLLLGKILYAPATPVSNAIIAKVRYREFGFPFHASVELFKVNKTFEELDKIHQFAKTWVESPLNLTALLGDLRNTNNIKVSIPSHRSTSSNFHCFSESSLESNIPRIIQQYHRNEYLRYAIDHFHVRKSRWRDQC